MGGTWSICVEAIGDVMMNENEYLMMGLKHRTLRDERLADSITLKDYV